MGVGLGHRGQQQGRGRHEEGDVAEHLLRREVDDAEVRDEGTDADDGDDRREAQDDTFHAVILAGWRRWVRAGSADRREPHGCRSRHVGLSPSWPPESGRRGGRSGRAAPARSRRAARRGGGAELDARRAAGVEVVDRQVEVELLAAVLVGPARLLVVLERAEPRARPPGPVSIAYSSWACATSQPSTADQNVASRGASELSSVSILSSAIAMVVPLVWSAGVVVHPA